MHGANLLMERPAHRLMRILLKWGRISQEKYGVYLSRECIKGTFEDNE